MAEIQFADTVIPFKCDNPDCGKEYDLDRFSQAVLFWGYIYFLAEEDEVALVGLTCLNCNKTTIRKYRAYMAMSFLSDVKMNLQKKFQVNQSTSTRDWWRYKHFSLKALIDSGLITEADQNTGSESETLYSCADEIKFEDYSQQLQQVEPFLLPENDISVVLSLENERSFKAMPRVVPLNVSAHENIDSMLFDSSHEHINTCFRSLLRPNEAFRVNPYKDLSRLELDERIKNSDLPIEIFGSFLLEGSSWEHKKLTQEEERRLLAQNDLLIEEYGHFLIGSLSWKRKEFQNNVDDFLHDLKRIRNRIDCEKVFKNDLINKYGRQFYFKTRTLEEQRADYNELAEIEDAGGVEAYVLGDDTIDTTTKKLPQNERKLRPNQRHKIAVRKIAEKLWKVDPDKTIADMIREDEINKVYLNDRDTLYTDDTLRGWINDLCPNPKRGRPSKKDTEK